MFKPAHGVDGVLTASLTAIAPSIKVDDNSYCILQRVLADGSYTYLVIKQNFTVEIVKATSTMNGVVLVTRAQDNTVASAFSSGASVEFVFTEQAIADIISDKTLGEIQLVGKGIVTVTKIATNSYTIGAPKINIISESEKILVGGEFPNFVLSTPLTDDCCGK